LVAIDTAMVKIMAVTLQSTRELRGLEILGKGDQIKRIDADTYKVNSQNGNGSYLVVRNGKEWACECPDHQVRQVVCKHIYAVYFSLNFRQKVFSKVQPIIETQDEGCRYCGSMNVVKMGVRHNIHGNIQRYLCKDCKRKFAENDGFEKVKATPKAITMALDLYFKGVSQRKIVEHLKMFEDVKVTQPCVLKWIRKYIELMKEYLDKLTPQLGGMWHSDEMMINVRKTEPIDGENYSWAWNLLDHETRFLIASEVTKHRNIEDARQVFQEAKQVANGQKPNFIITDKLPAYTQAIKKEFFTLRNPRTKHVKLKSIREGTNNNIVERLHGTIRERTKVMRGLDNDRTAQTMMDANRIYYNYLRPHQTLNGHTPAEKAGIDLQLEGNKWEDLIRKAQHNPKVIKDERKE
jgi:transposase-like protein/RNase P subunit RPR2